jgi:hypothetical protein
MNPMIPVHVAGGTLALLAGFAALFLFAKGGRLHALAGNAFFFAMLVMAGTGALVASLIPERGTAVIGLITCYLVATSWMTARRRDGRAGTFERAAFATIVALGLTQLTLSVMAASAANGRVDSLPAGAHFPFVVIAFIAAALDFGFIRRGVLTGRQRIGRHLWRMCAALAIAAFSFFLGQQKVMPEWMQGSPWLFVPPLATLAAMIFWILRVRFAKAWLRPALRRPRDPGSPPGAEPLRAA